MIWISATDVASPVQRSATRGIREVNLRRSFQRGDSPRWAGPPP